VKSLCKHNVFPMSSFVDIMCNVKQSLLVEEYHAGVCMPREDYVSGQWEPHIVQAAALKNSWALPVEDTQAFILNFVLSLT